MRSDQDRGEVEGGEGTSTSESSEESDEDEFYDSKSNPLGQCDSDDEFMDPECEKLVNSEGPQGMLQLMLQERTDEIMTKDDSDDYADLIKWSSDAEENRLRKWEVTHLTIGRALSPPHKPDHDFVIPAIFQTARASTEAPNWMNMGSNNSGQHWENIGTCSLGIRANWATALSGSIALIRRDFRCAMHPLGDYLSGRRLKSKDILISWLT